MLLFLTQMLKVLLDARAKVSKLKGSISGVSVAKETKTGIKFYRQSGNTFVGIASTSLNLQNGVIVNVGGFSTTRKNLVRIILQSEFLQIVLFLRQGIGTAGATGIVTFL